MNIRTPIRWMNGDEEELKGRSTKFYSYPGVLMAEIPIPDGEFVCDYCNDEILQRPFPIVGTYAICLGCQVKYGIEKGQLEFVESA